MTLDASLGSTVPNRSLLAIKYGEAVLTMYHSAREFEPLRLSCVIFEVTYNADLGVEMRAFRDG